MCAACHSTGLRRRYDADARRFDTQWAEVDVSCEACHGPGAAHVAWAGARRPRRRREPGAHRRPDAARRHLGASATASPSRTSRRRARAAPSSTPAAAATRAPREIAEEDAHGQPLAQTHIVATLDERPLPRRRPDPRRGLRVRLVPAEPHARRRRGLQRLPRSAQRPAARRGQRAVRDLPPRRRLRHARAPPPRRRQRRGALRRAATCWRATTWSSTGVTITASASPAPISPPRPGDARHLHRLSPRSLRALGRRRGGEVVRTRAAPRPALRDRPGRRPRPTPPPPVRRCSPRSPIPPSRPSPAPPRWICMPPYLAARDVPRRRAGAARSRPAGAPRRAGAARRRGSRAPLADRRAAARRPGAQRAPRRRQRARRRGRRGDAAGRRSAALFDRAVAEYRAVQMLNADRAESWLNLGALDARLGHAAAAEAAYRRAIEADPALPRPPTSTSPISTASSAATPRAKRCCARG